MFVCLCVYQEVFAYINRTTHDTMVMSRHRQNGAVVTSYVSTRPIPADLSLLANGMSRILVQFYYFYYYLVFELPQISLGLESEARLMMLKLPILPCAAKYRKLV